MPAENIQYRPNLNNHKADIVVVGGGPAGIHLTHELHKRFGVGLHTLLLEQSDTLGGSGHASMQQTRTFQSNRHMVEMIAQAREWYDQVGHEMHTNLVTPLPYLFVAADQKQLSQLNSTLKNVQEWGHGKGGEIWTPEITHQNFPFVDGDVAGALYYPEAAQLDFSAAINFVTKVSHDTIFAVGTPMTNIRIKRGKVIGVDTPQGFVATEQVVLATGPFAIKTEDQTIGGTLGTDAKLKDMIAVRKRQRFTAAIKGLPPHTKIFVISPGSQYVRLHTEEDGTGYGDYGYADENDPIITEPVINPRATEMEFPATVYFGLGQVISGYGDEENVGPLARSPRSRVAGYYADTRDNMPIVCGTPIDGLFLDVAHSHAGVMSMGAASHITNIMDKGEPADNPFRINREFSHDGIKL